MHTQAARLAPGPAPANRARWSDYAKDAALLAGFVASAGALATLLEYPGSPVRAVIDSAPLRRVALGVAMAGVTAGLVYSPWGKRTGAMMNPVVALAFWRLGRIGGRDALLHSAFHFAGAAAASQALLWAIGAPFAAEPVRHGATLPGPAGAGVAFAAEFVISFVLMLALLAALGSKRWEKRAGVLIAALIGVYIAVESPLSGMSLNPARSLGAALTAGRWDGLWLYFVAPALAMLLAAELYRWTAGGGRAVVERLPRYPAQEETPP